MKPLTFLFIFVFAAKAAFSAECDSPEKVANAFLQYDIEGSRLDGDASTRIDELETDDLYEPGWDIVTLISSYEVKAIRQDGSNEAVASVLFKDIWETEGEFAASKVKDENAELHLRKVNGCWKIAPPAYNPHISAKVLLEHLKRLEQEAKSHANSKQEKEYLIEVQQKIADVQNYQLSR